LRTVFGAGGVPVFSFWGCHARIFRPAQRPCRAVRTSGGFVFLQNRWRLHKLGPFRKTPLTSESRFVKNAFSSPIRGFEA
jgi:hypothetical protein